MNMKEDKREAIIEIVSTDVVVLPQAVMRKEDDLLSCCLMFDVECFCSSISMMGHGYWLVL